MENKSQKNTSKRLTREAWLEKALNVLSKEGNGKLRIASITAALGVSKGSFYWHFKDRADFLHALLKYWEDFFTRRVRDAAEVKGGTAKERLCHVMAMVIREDLSKYDTAFDAWAAHEPDIRPKVQSIYQFRYDYIRSLFRELGFRGNELDLRVQAFRGYLRLISFPLPDRRQFPSKNEIEKRLEFFLRP